jgi:hypothetical protein
MASVGVPSIPPCANSTVAARRISSRRSSAVSRVLEALVVMGKEVSSHLLHCQANLVDRRRL